MNPDSESISLFRVVLASITIIGLLGLFAFGLRYFVERGWLTGLAPTPKRRRLKLVETLPIDARRRLVVIKCDGVEHLLLIGSSQDVVVASPLPPAPPALDQEMETR